MAGGNGTEKIGVTETFRVGPWVVNPALNIFKSPGQSPVRVEGRVVEVLVFLSQHPNEVLSKETILRSVWCDSFVSEDALFRCIKELRRLFGDDAKSPRFIETIPKRGYRLIADVERSKPAAETTEPPVRQAPHSVSQQVAAWKLVALFLLVAALALGGPFLFRALFPSAGTITSMAVVPFVSLPDSAELDYLGVGIADSIAFSLSQLEGLKVISNLSSLHYLDTETIDPKSISEALGVRGLLLGKIIRREDGQFTVSVEFVDGQQNQMLWGDTFVGTADEIIRIQSDIVGHVLEVLEAGEVQAGASQERYETKDHSVYLHYLKGRFHWAKTTREGFFGALDEFNRALAIDPDYAPAYSGLADTYSTLGFFRFLPPETAFSRAKEAAWKALELNSELAEAHTSLAGVLRVSDWDVSSSEEHFRKALRLNPAYPTAYHWYSLFSLAPSGRTSEALEAMRKAHELAPLSVRVNTGLGYVLYVSGKAEEAIQQFKETSKLDPSYMAVYLYLGLAYLELGDMGNALGALQKGVEVSKQRALPLLGVAYARAQMGEKDKALELLEEVIEMREESEVSSYELGVVYAALGEVDSALTWFERAMEEKDYALLYLKVDPRLKTFPRGERFESIIRRVGL